MSPEQFVYSRYETIIRPRARLTIPKWADEYRFLGRGVSAISKEGPARYRSDFMPHQIKPQLEVHNPEVGLNVWMMASQLAGKTEMGNNIIFYHMHWRPTNCVVMYPTGDLAENFARKKFNPNIQATPVLKEVLSHSTSTMVKKDFLGGCVFIVTSNSTSSLRSASGEVLWGDEIDDYPQDVDGQGDPLELLWRRGESYPNRIRIASSTPTIEGSSRIQRLMDESDYQRWETPCPKCSERAGQLHGWQALEWEQFIIPDKDPMKCFIECRHCNAQLNDADRLWMYYHGDWRATKPFNGTRGFHFPGFLSPLPAHKEYRDRLHEAASEFLKASKSQTRLKVWINLFKTEVFKLAGKSFVAADLMKRCESYPILPHGALMVVCAIDTQEDRFELEFVAVGESEETWGLDYMVVTGNTAFDDVYERLHDVIADRTYTHPSGKTLSPAAIFIDCRHQPRQVMRWVRKWQLRGLNIYGAIGAKDEWEKVLCSKRPSKHVDSRARWFKVGSGHAKCTIAERSALEKPGPGYMHYPIGRGYDEEYFKMLASEKLIEEWEDDIVVKRYWKKTRARNEALDIRVMILAIVFKLNPNWGKLAKGLQVQGETPKETANAPEQNEPGEKKPNEKPPIVPQKQINKFKQGGFVGRWRRF